MNLIFLGRRAFTYSNSESLDEVESSEVKQKFIISKNISITGTFQLILIGSM
jgi:hypothetical protein